MPTLSHLAVQLVFVCPPVAGLGLVAIAVLTLPHVVVVSWLDVLDVTPTDGTSTS